MRHLRAVEIVGEKESDELINLASESTPTYNALERVC